MPEHLLVLQWTNLLFGQVMKKEESHCWKKESNRNIVCNLELGIYLLSDGTKITFLANMHNVTSVVGGRGGRLSTSPLTQYTIAR